MSSQTVANRNQQAATHHALGLADVLERLNDAHEEMLTLAGVHRDALAHADGAGIEDVTHRRGLAADRIAALDRTRRVHTEALRAALDLRTERSLTDLVSQVEDRHAVDRVSEASKQLRSTMTRLRREHNVIRASTLTLCTHLEGVMRHAMRALAEAGTYTNRGTVHQTRPAPTRVDVAR